MKVITFDWLDEQGACWRSLQSFSDLFGRECAMTQANVWKWLDEGPYGAVHDLGWLVLHLLGRYDRKHYCWRSLPLARKVLDYLGTEKTHWDSNALSPVDELKKLPRRRLIKAVVQIANLSPNL